MTPEQKITSATGYFREHGAKIFVFQGQLLEVIRFFDQPAFLYENIKTKHRFAAAYGSLLFSDILPATEEEIRRYS